MNHAILIKQQIQFQKRLKIMHLLQKVLSIIKLGKLVETSYTNDS